MTAGEQPGSGAFAERPTTLDDAALLARLLNDAVRPYLGRDVMPVEVFDSILRMPTLDPGRDGRVVLLDGQPVAASIVAAHEPFGFARVYVAVPPHKARRAVAEAAFGCGLATAHRRVELSPGTELLAEVPAGDEELKSVLADLGFEHRFTSCEMHRELAAPLPAPQWPPDVTVTAMPTDVAALTRIGEANREAFADHDGDHAMPVDDFVHMVRTAPTWRPDQSVVAWRGDRPVGLALNGIEEVEAGDAGYVGFLAVRREARGTGLGRALLLASFERMAAAGLSHVMLNVQLGNRSGADRLYRSVGMTPGAQEQTWGRSLGETTATTATTDRR